MFLMMGRNICFKGVIWKIIPKLSVLPLLIWSIELQTCYRAKKILALGVLLQSHSRMSVKVKQNLSVDCVDRCSCELDCSEAPGSMSILQYQWTESD